MKEVIASGIEISNRVIRNPKKDELVLEIKYWTAASIMIAAGLIGICFICFRGLIGIVFFPIVLGLWILVEKIENQRRMSGKRQ